MQQQQQQSQSITPQFTFEGGHVMMYHKDPAAQQATDATVNDADRVRDLLNQEKHLSLEYNLAMNEASHDHLFQVFRQCFDTCHQLQRQFFATAFKKGWYRLPIADAQFIADTYTKAQQDRSQLSFGGQQTQSGASATQGTQSWSQSSNAQSTSPVDQQLYRQVDQVLQQAEQGKGFPGRGRRH